MSIRLFIITPRKLLFPFQKLQCLNCTEFFNTATVLNIRQIFFSSKLQLQVPNKR